MAKKADGNPPTGDSARRRGSKANVVSSTRRGGPGKGFWIVAAAVAVIGIGALYWQTTKPKTMAQTIDPSLPTLKAEGYVIGSPSAPVEIVEYADFECPGCGQFATLTEPDVRARLVNTGQVRMRFMDFPLPMHKNTWDASLAAACANEQGKFWEMHDQIFANQDRWNGEATGRPRNFLAGLAQGVGLDMSRYNSCMDTDKFRAQIQANQAEGVRRQVGQTPTFEIGGQLIAGALPYDTFKKLVEDAAKKAGATPPAAADTTKKK